jgi:hypothetical protein
MDKISYLSQWYGRIEGTGLEPERHTQGTWQHYSESHDRMIRTCLFFDRTGNRNGRLD